MKRVFALLILLGLVYGGWIFYREYRASGTVPAIASLAPTEMVMGDSQDAWDNLQSVLGASIGRAVETGRDWVNEASGGQAEPVVNRAIHNFQEELKQLPKDQVEQIKYDFCKPIVEEYEKN